VDVGDSFPLTAPLFRRFRFLGTCALRAHRLAARPKGLDREPGPSRAHAPAARASSPLGDFARRDPDCDRVDESGGALGFNSLSRLVAQRPPRLKAFLCRRSGLRRADPPHVASLGRCRGRRRSDRARRGLDL